MKRVLAVAVTLTAALGLISAATTHHAPATTAVRHEQFIDPPWVPRTFTTEVSRDMPIHAEAASPPAPVTTTTAPPATTTTVAPTTTTTSVVHHTSTATTHVSAQSSGYSSACYPSTGMAPRNSTEACISSKEHGGCYDRSANPSHFGRWQFDRQTWAGNGGSPAHWGYASPAEQDAVFRATVEAHGYGSWTRYDGC